jgi:hypothetical protein
MLDDGSSLELPHQRLAGGLRRGADGIFAGARRRFAFLHRRIRIGWIGLVDYGEKPASWRLHYFRAGAADSVLYQEATWQAVEEARQHTTRADAFFQWLLNAPEVPVDVKQRVKAHLIARTNGS